MSEKSTIMEKFRFITFNSSSFSSNKEVDERQDVCPALREEDHNAYGDEDLDQICREAAEACLKNIMEHLDEFTDEFLHCTYEQWIRSLHPENVINDQIDHRFYVEQSDHRLLWNLYMEKEGRFSYKVEPCHSAPHLVKSV